MNFFQSTLRAIKVTITYKKLQENHDTETLVELSDLGLLSSAWKNDEITKKQEIVVDEQIKNYEDISKKRFSNIDKTVYASGYRSFFDITPDLRFILGKDSKYTNLFHNLGSGQAMKYSPVLGESVAEEIMNEPLITKKFDYKKFNINRFGDDYMKEFWNLVQGEENTLHRQGKNSL